MKKIFKNKKSFILILFFVLSITITSKIEAWGYFNLKGEWINALSEVDCKMKLEADYISRVTSVCQEDKIIPKTSGVGNYYFVATLNNKDIRFPFFLLKDDCEKVKTEYKSLHSEAVLSECKIDIVSVDAQKDTTTDANKVYTLLAPIGGLETAPDNIGDYFNTMFEIIIGICAVLAVIMIVLGGIQYMGNESVFGKTEAKSQIWKAILGLLIALASFALLNTIDPNLLGRGGLNIKQVSAEIEEPPILSDEGKTIPTKNNFTDCPGGVRTVNTATVQFIFCSAYASKLQGLISAAQTDGIKLSGGSFRTYEEQIQARKNNRCPDVFTSPSSSCRPPTAIPGTSLHEQGLAVDFRCNGNSMEGSGGRNSPCFKWLSKNAASYGFKNFYKESWHWSTGPRAGS